MLTASNSGKSPKRKIVWTESKGLFTLNTGGFCFKVAPKQGGRIVSLNYRGEELLYTHGDMSGSTFWPSPQSVWHWPPPAALDNLPYQVEIFSDKLSILSSIDKKNGLQLRKIFSIASPGCVQISYEMKNCLSRVVCVAPWEITRVGVGGITFFPSGQEISVPSTLIPTWEDTIVWYNHDGTDDKKKLFRDGTEKWIAHLKNNLVFIKSWEEDTQPDAFAPDEAEIELYSASNYLEIENQGSYAKIPPKKSTIWNVFWQVRTLPDGIKKGIGSTDLIDFVRGLV